MSESTEKSLYDRLNNGRATTPEELEELQRVIVAGVATEHVRRVSAHPRVGDIGFVRLAPQRGLKLLGILVWTSDDFGPTSGRFAILDATGVLERWRNAAWCSVSRPTRNSDAILERLTRPEVDQ